MGPANEILIKNLERLNTGGALRRELETHEPENVSWEIKPDGNPALNINGSAVYQPESAIAHVAQEINAFLENQDPDLVVFFGLGLGLHVQFMRLKTSKPILIFEPSLDVLANVLPKIPMDFENVTLITNTGHLIEAAGKILSRAKDKLAVGAIIPYRNIYPTEFENFRIALGQALKNIVISQATKATFSSEWITYLKDNLPVLVGSPPLHALGDLFKGKPGILVGAGPSLDTNIEVLKEAKGRALICAVHTAVMPLAKAGITPDIVVLIESQHLDYYFQDVENIDQMVLAPAPHTHPEHLHMGFKGLLTISLAGHPVSDWLKQAYGIAPLESGGSVACTTLSLLHSLGCDPIIQVGMDTAFTNNRTHAGEAQTGCCHVKKDPESDTMSFTYLDERQADGQWDAQMVMAWGGKEQVMTRMIFSSFRNWFEAANQTWASDRTLINATEGGARFEGFVEMRLADALKKYAQDQIPVTQWLEKGMAANDLLKPSLLGEEIRKEISTVTQATAVAGKAEEEANTALKKLNAGQLGNLQPTLDKLAENEGQLQKLTQQTRLLNMLVGHRAMALSTTKPAGEDKVSLTIHSVKISREISRLIIKAGDEMLEIFTPVIAELQ